MDALRLGTRGSQLALFQANAVADLLRLRSGTACEITVIKTSGDRLAEATLSEIGGKRLFVKEIEDALLESAIDLAVHSSKDMPAALPPGLAIGAVLAREDPRDAVVLPKGAGEPLPLDEVIRRLGRHPRIGTSSVRRSAQLVRLFPEGRFLPIRGNLDTRLRKLDEGQFDAIVLAAAGLRRLKFDSRISGLLPPDASVPAPGQGIIAVETRSDDARVRALVASINESSAAAALAAERALVARLGGGCQMPIGGFASEHGAELRMIAIVVLPDGSRAVRAEVSGSITNPELVGIEAAEQLLARGAGEILAEVVRAQVPVEGIKP